MTNPANENIKDVSCYFREVNIELYGGNDVVKAFSKIWNCAFALNLDKIAFVSNGHKVTIEKIKS
jgi:hypothetical protein